MAEEAKREPDPKYGMLDPELIALLKEYEIKYFREDKPVPFAPGLTIYPVQVRDFEEFAGYSGCLSLNKNETVKGIRMSNLEFLLSKIDEPGVEGQIWNHKIHRLFEMIFHLQPGFECLECHKVLGYSSEEATAFFKACEVYIQSLMSGEIKKEGSEEILQEPKLACPSCGNEKFRHVIQITQDPETKKRSLVLGEHTLTKEEFNKLRQIVLFQNFSDYVDDSWVDPDLKKDRDERLRLEQKRNDLHASIEEKVVCLSISTHYNFSEIYDMSIRRFTMALGKVDDLINYKLLKSAQYSGFASLPKDFKVEHWIYKPTKDMYGDSYRDKDSIQAV